jgi:hypothetical protein
MIETQRPSHGEPDAGPAGGGARGRSAGRWHHQAPLLAAVLALSAAVVTQATPALAATTPQVSIACAAANDCTATGTGFTPSGKVQVQALAGTTAFYSSTIVASATTEVCVQGLKPHCVDVPGGLFSAALPIDYGLACNATAAGAMQYTDVSSGTVVAKPVTWTGPCATPTTTTLLIPSSVESGFTAVNPAIVTAGSTTVTWGTVTISVNGVPYCSYAAGASSGCTLTNLPLLVDQIQASYSGSLVPYYAPSSASESVTVWPFDE